MNLAEQVKNKYSAFVLDTSSNAGDPVVIAKKESVKNLMAALRADSDFDFNLLMDLTAVDYLFWEEKEKRFEIVYNLYSLRKKHRLFVKAQVREADASIDSVTEVWPAADWYEREVWDMFGIRFAGHSNLKRILMYEGFEGYPLRKDYPYNQRQPLIGPMN